MLLRKPYKRENIFTVSIEKNPKITELKGWTCAVQTRVVQGHRHTETCHR